MTPSTTVMKRHQLGREGEHPWGDLGQLILLALFLTVWALDSFLIHFSTQPASFLPLAARLAAAGLILLAAVDFARKGHRVVSEETRRQGRLLKDGVFARVRHPLYLATLLFYAALVVATGSLLSLAVLGGIFLFTNAIAGYEEKHLIRKHGRDYQEYMNAVGRWIPRFPSKA